MTTNDLINIIAKHHDEWIKIIKAHTINKTEIDYAEDFVQEAYIKIISYAKPERIVSNGVLNKSYVFFVLKSVLYDYRKAKKGIKKNYLEECKNCDRAEEASPTMDNLVFKMDQITTDWYWYDKKLFEIYKNECPSIRKISQKTGISTNSIYKTLKKCKSEIYEKLKKDYQEYQEATI